MSRAECSDKSDILLRAEWYGRQELLVILIRWMMEEKGGEDKRVWYGVFKCDRDVRVSNNVRVSQVQSLLPLLFVSYKIFHATNIAS